MKIKEFLKSKEFKCIAVLLAIALVCSGLLAILSDVLSVSADERTARSLKKIYGYEVTNYDTVEIDKQIDVSEYGTIDLLYRIDNGENDYDLLFKATGDEGYKNGTITVWVQVNVKNNQAKFVKTILADYEKQTLMSKLGSSYYNAFEYNGKFYSITTNENSNKNVVSGATKSSNAGNNAVNCVIKYVKEAIK